MSDEPQKPLVNRIAESLLGRSVAIHIPDRDMVLRQVFYRTIIAVDTVEDGAVNGAHNTMQICLSHPIDGFGRPYGENVCRIATVTMTDVPGTFEGFFLSNAQPSNFTLRVVDR